MVFVGFFPRVIALLKGELMSRYLSTTVIRILPRQGNADLQRRKRPITVAAAVAAAIIKLVIAVVTVVAAATAASSDSQAEKKTP